MPCSGRSEPRSSRLKPRYYRNQHRAGQIESRATRNKPHSGQKSPVLASTSPVPASTSPVPAGTNQSDTSWQAGRAIIGVTSRFAEDFEVANSGTGNSTPVNVANTAAKQSLPLPMLVLYKFSLRENFLMNRSQYFCLSSKEYTKAWGWPILHYTGQVWVHQRLNAHRTPAASLPTLTQFEKQWRHVV